MSARSLKTPEYDLIVVGAGVSGLGAAVEARRRGRSVALIEKRRCCQATSLNSLRIIHGGLRYLQTLNLKRVRESMRAQSELMRDYPEHVKPLACAMPLNPFSGKNKLALTAASWIYRALAAAEGHEVGKIAFLDRSQTRDLLPLLAPAAKHGVFTWTDAQVPEVQVFNDVLRTEAIESGVVLLEDTRVTKIQRTSLGFSVGIQGSEDGSQLSSRCVINSSGPWIDSIEVNGVPEFSPPARLLVSRIQYRSKAKDRKQSRDWGSHSAGTAIVPSSTQHELSDRNIWYLKLNSTADSAQISEQEVSAALQEMNSCLPDLNLSFDDVSNIECGVLPVKRYVLERPVLFGSERIECRHGYLDLTSTKYTTFRTQAKRVVSQLDPFFSKQVGIVGEHKSGTKRG